MTEKRSYVLIVDVPISVAIEVQAESIEKAIEFAREADWFENVEDFNDKSQGVWSPGKHIDYEPRKGELVDLHVNGELAAFVPRVADLFDDAVQLWEAAKEKGE